MASMEQAPPIGVLEPSQPAIETENKLIERLLTRVFMLDWVSIFYVGMFVAAILTRFIGIGDRVLSHDESLHSNYSYQLWKTGSFTHTPLMHGPVIFHMTALSFFLFGDSDATARFYPAVLGVILVMMPKFLFEKWLGKRGAMITTVLLLISPMVLFHSRYIREDIPAIFFTMLMVYSLLRYIDPTRPRQIRWLMLLSGATLLSLASKETGFMYIAIFGSFLTLFWVMQIIRDLRTGELSPIIGQILGGLVALVVIVGLAVVLGGSIANLVPSISRIAVEGIVLALLVLVAGAFFTPIRQLSGAIFGRFGENSYSIFMTLMNAIVLGAIGALIMTVIVNIDPLQNALGGTDPSARSHLIVWTLITAAVLIGLVLITALIGFWNVRRLPWTEVITILVIALVVCAGLLFVEERSIHAPNVSSDHAVAVEPGSQTASGLTTTGNGGQNTNSLTAIPILNSILDKIPILKTIVNDILNNMENRPIWISVGIGIVAIIFVLILRFRTPFFQEMKRYPTFDTLIIMATLILPWFAAFPMFQGGYAVDAFPPTTQTAQAALLAEVPFVALAVVTGLCWNPAAWLACAATFYSLFAFFYTTVFTNSNGIYSGVVGSLGYWLMQQGVRRGSQPQIYYMVVQLPIYEFLPSIGGLIAAVAGMIAYWRWRANRYIAAMERSLLPAEVPIADQGDPLAAMVIDEALPISGDPIAFVDSSASSDIPLSNAPDFAAELPADPFAAVSFDQPFAPPPDQSEVDTSIGVEPVRAVDPNIDPATGEPLLEVIEVVAPIAPRIIPAWIEKIETVPFLAFVGYWSVMILYAFTLSGEKMPWLTTQLTIPFILATGFFLGTLLDHVEWGAFFRRGWGLLILVPLLGVGLANLIGLAYFKDQSQRAFGGLSQDQLLQTGVWFAALLLTGLVAYGIFWIWRQIGLRQTARIALLGAFVLLGILTARTAWRFAYINYDSATEFGVYAHGAPAYKVVMSQLEQLSKQTTDGMGIKVGYDDLVSWPGTWYFRNYTHTTFLGDTSGSTDLNTYAALLVGQAHGDTVEAQLGDQYYKYNFIRMWWPMQDYFNLTPDKLDTFFASNSSSSTPGAANPSELRKGIWDIWWNRSYTAYGTATNQNFDVSQWPVVDRMDFFVRKDIAAQVWNMGVGGAAAIYGVSADPFVKLRCTTCAADMTISGDTETNLTFNNPHGVTIAPDGKLYVADTLNGRILIYSTDGKLLSQFGVPDAISVATNSVTPAPGQFKEPWAVAVGNDGWIYVADTWNSRVQVFDSQHNPQAQWGVLETFGGGQAGSPVGFWGPRGIAVDEQNRIYVADTGNKRIRIYDRTGNLLSTIGGPGGGNGKLNEPVGLAYDPKTKHLFVADTWNKRIQVFSTVDNSFVSSWAVTGWKGSTEDTGTRPFLALDPTGTRLYATEPDFGQVLAWDVSQLNAQGGEVPLVQFGVKGTSLDNVHFNLTSGIAVDSKGEVFVADSADNRILRFAPATLPQTIAVAPINNAVSGNGAINGGVIQNNPLQLFGTQLATAAVTQPATQAVIKPVTQVATQAVTVAVTQPPTQAVTQAATVTGF